MLGEPGEPQKRSGSLVLGKPDLGAAEFALLSPGFILSCSSSCEPDCHAWALTLSGAAV